MGSVGAAAILAEIVFLALAVYGIAAREIRNRIILTLIGIGIAVWLALPRIAANGDVFITPALAVIDIALVFAIFKGDMRLG